MPALPAQAQTQKVLYSFAGGSDGAQPFQAGVVFDMAGNLYGVTQSGGAYNQGTVFKLTPSPDGTWTETVLYSFTGGSDGSLPQGGLATDGLVYLYGTTAFGGTNNDSCGTLFALQINEGPYFELLHTFDDVTGDGCQPESDVLYNGVGAVGTTAYGGGPREPGTFFVYQEGDYWSWHFPGDTNWYPNGLSQFGSTYYGTAYSGGDNHEGDVFEGTKAKHFFYSSKDGFHPIGNLATQVSADGVRIMYGATYAGGVEGRGTVYQLKEINSEDKWAVSLVHAFSGPDGAYPWGGVVLDAAGNLYGTTTEGGAANLGTIFELTPGPKKGWTYTLLHSFSGGADGANPTGSLVFDDAGNLYGTTSAGGAYGQGVVYEIPNPTSLTSATQRSMPRRRLH